MEASFVGGGGGWIGGGGACFGGWDFVSSSFLKRKGTIDYISQDVYDLTLARARSLGAFWGLVFSITS